MSFAQFIATLKARRLTFALVALTVIALVTAVSFLLPKKYTATAVVVIDVKSPDPIAGMVLPGLMAPTYMATQLEIIKSDRVAQRVIAELKLADQPQLRSDWEASTDSQGNFSAWLAEVLQRNLDATPSREANVINVAYTAVDPNFAATMANAFVRAYLETTVELKVNPAKQYSALFDNQAKLLRERIETAQSRLSAYQKAQGLIANDERLDVETAKLNELSSQLIGLQAIATESMSRKAQAGANMSEVLNNPVVAGLKADLARQEAKLKEMSSQLGSAHPQVVQMQANISELRTRIDTEIGRVTSSVGITNTVNQTREAQVRAALEQQRQKLLKLKEQRDQAAVLMRDVDDAQRAHDAVQARFSQTNLESQSTQTNVAALKAATPPATFSSPKIMINIIVSVFLGLSLATGVCVLLEMLDKRLRTPGDILEQLGVPIMATIPRPSAPLVPPVPGAKSRLLGLRALPELPRLSK